MITLRALLLLSNSQLHFIHDVGYPLRSTEVLIIAVYATCGCRTIQRLARVRLNQYPNIIVILQYHLINR